MEYNQVVDVLHKARYKDLIVALIEIELYQSGILLNETSKTALFSAYMNDRNYLGIFNDELKKQFIEINEKNDYPF